MRKVPKLFISPVSVHQAINKLLKYQLNYL